ncbi:serine protease [Veronia pacifica]|uniref:Peptidase S1 domain-containing protein n=1 Tax=Veronia pacifica TaxID=1080227 RepID=A0A1C3EGF2_9GAMM|nr:serine protease [Veronia pacifica]ODA32299.1 hypothetical protein A8L45_13295 [Veronia pacifica]
MSVYSLSVFLALNVVLSGISYAELNTQQVDKMTPPTVSPYIVAGKPAQNGEVPWQVYLVAGNFTCGGAVISREYILTAAHCVDSNHKDGKVEAIEPSRIRVYAGFTYRGAVNFNNSGYQVSEAHIYTDYKEANLRGDLALLKLSTSLPESVKPIRLLPPSKQVELDSEFKSGKTKNLFVSGWGKTGTDLQNDGHLYRTHLTGIPDYQCSWMDHDYPGYAHICASDPRRATGTCSGDSGGPLVWQDPSHTADADRGYRVVGIVSFGSAEGCGLTYREDVFTQVSSYFNWIDKTIEGGYQSTESRFTVDIFDPDEMDYPSTPLSVQSEPQNQSAGAIQWVLFVLIGLFGLQRRRSFKLPS